MVKIRHWVTSTQIGLMLFVGILMVSTVGIAWVVTERLIANHYDTNAKPDTVQTDLSVQQRLSTEKRLRYVALQNRSIVAIESDGARLTGFFVDPRGYFLTAAHGRFRNATRIQVVLSDGKNIEIRSARFVDEIQTLDIALLAIGKSLMASGEPIRFTAVSFADLPAIVERGRYYQDNEMHPEKQIVVMRCVNEAVWNKINRVLIGTIRVWEKDEPMIQMIQRQQNSAGCSGAPLLTLDGKVVGMLRSSAGDTILAIDAPSLQEAVRLLIAEDEKQGK